MEDASPHFRSFAKTLELALTKYEKLDEASIVELQRKQVDGLAQLEDEFRIALNEHKQGPVIYAAFFRFIREIKRNILAARPYFRERQEVFASSISGALKNRDAVLLGKFHLNFHFISFTMKAIHFGRYSKLAKIAKKIEEAREELVVMNLPLVVSRARVFWSRTPKAHLSFLDLIQIGCEGLIAGVDKYAGTYADNWAGVCIGRMTGNFISSYSLDQDTILYPWRQKPKKISDFRKGDQIYGVDQFGQKVLTNVVALHDHGWLEGIEVTFDDGYQVVCSAIHKFLTKEGMVPLRDIVGSGLGVCCEPSLQNRGLEVPLRSRVPYQAGEKSPSNWLRFVQEEIPGIKNSRGESDRGEVGPSRGMGKSLWNSVLQKEASLYSSRELSSVSCADKCPEAQEHLCVEGRESRRGESCCFEASRRFFPMAKRESRGSSQSSRTRAPKVENVAQRSSRGKCQDNFETSCVRSADFPVRGLSEGGGDSNLAGRANSLRRKDEADRFYFRRSQDLGGSGWVLALFYSRGDGSCQRTVSLSTEQRQDVGCRGFTPGGCYVNPSGNGLFFTEKTEGVSLKGGLEGMVIKEAPVSRAGGFVLRKIIRLRYVGFRRMYDIEVSSLEHNFLLSNGTVTSNSAAMLHFYPSDQRKIYRAHKYLSKHLKGDFDIGDVVKRVNDNAGENQKTNDEELADLIAAASMLSADTKAPGEIEDIPANINKFEAPYESRPDVQVETNEAMAKMKLAIESLCVFDKKILRLKGVDLGQ